MLAAVAPLAEFVSGVFAVCCVTDKDCDEWIVIAGLTFLGTALAISTMSVMLVTLR